MCLTYAASGEKRHMRLCKPWLVASQKERRADAVRSCRRAVAVALQTGVANQIHSAGTPPALAADISYIAGPPSGSHHNEMQYESDFENTQGSDNTLGSQTGFPGNAAVAGGG